MSFWALTVLSWLITLMCCVFDALSAYALMQERTPLFYAVVGPILFVTILLALSVQLYGPP